MQNILAGTTAHEKNLLATLGLASVSEGGLLFCGVTAEAFAINGVTYAWQRGSELTWGIEFSRLGQLSDMDCKDAVDKALKEISGCCDVRHRYVAMASGANLRLTSQRLDGPSGVLADFEIPPVGGNPGSQQLRGRFDDGERWVLSESPAAGTIDFYRVALHELLHGHGLGHKPASVPGQALIAPIYSPAVGHLMQLDIAELIRRYGESGQPAVPVAPGGAKVVSGDFTINVDGVNFKAAGQFRRQ